MRRHLFVAILSFGFLWLSGALVWAAHYWSIGTAAANGGGDYACADVDSDDRPHISYHGIGGMTLMHAWWNGSTWATETVDGTALSIHPWTCVVVDSTDRPHICYSAYWAGPKYELRHARWDGSSWLFDTVEATATTTLYKSLALDSGDRPRIAYQDFQLKTLKYAVWTGASWSIGTVDSTGSVGYFCSLALTRKAPQDQARIAYYDSTNGVLKYAAWTGSAWAFQTVVSNGHWPSLALDSNDDARIAYTDRTTNSLQFAAWNGASWDISTVDAVTDYGHAKPSLALDASDHPRIAYNSGTAGALSLKYAEWTGTAWETETIDTTDSGHKIWYDSTSLALTAAGDPQISYLTSDPIGITWVHLQYAVTRGPLAVRWPR
jgi:hypothetical protein